MVQLSSGFSDCEFYLSSSFNTNAHSFNCPRIPGITTKNTSTGWLHNNHPWEIRWFSIYLHTSIDYYLLHIQLHHQMYIILWIWYIISHMYVTYISIQHSLISPPISPVPFGSLKCWKSKCVYVESEFVCVWRVSMCVCVYVRVCVCVCVRECVLMKAVRGILLNCWL